MPGKGRTSTEKASKVNGKGKVPAASSTAIEAGEEIEDDSSSSSSAEEEDVLARTSLNLSKNPMPPLDGLTKTLAQFSLLQKLDMSSMEPSSEAGNPHGLTNLKWLGKATKKGKSKGEGEISFGDRLTWLKVTDNPGLGEQGGAEVWNGLEKLKNLTVLNASSCALTIAPPPSILLELSSLAALILAHNSISVFTYVPHLPHLNTLVLSHNKITSLPKDLPANLPSLKKLSITQNALEWIKGESPLPDFSPCSHLREIRLAGNSRLTKLPLHLSTWGRGEGRDKMGSGLETLELADCGLKDFESIEALLNMGNGNEPPRRRRGLGNLTLKDNGVAKLPEYRQRILEVHNTLRTLDGEKVATKPTEEASKEVKGEESSQISSSEKIDKGSKKKKKKSERQEAEVTVEAENDNASPVDEKMDSTATAKLQRKRGKRGGSSSKSDAEPREKAHIDKHVRTKKDQIGRNKDGVDDRAASRAGPPPDGPDKKSKKTELSSKKDKKIVDKGQDHQPKKKRKAWDESDGKESKKPRADSPQQKTEKDDKVDKAQTSVAAVIQLGKKKSEAKVSSNSIWGQIGGAEESQFGAGSAWE